ncbi:molybdopterin molybdotransferase MoeA [Pseudoalteromonas gelatinilytica]
MKHSSLLSLEQAKKILLDGTTTITEAQMVPLNMLLDRVIATDVIAPINVPQHDNSAMDGYAIAFKGNQAKQSTTFKLIGKSLAGIPFGGELQYGQCIRITTGGVVPKGTDAVVMQENVEHFGDHIRLAHSVNRGEFIRKCGSDISHHQVLFHKGHRLTSIDIGLLASLGITEVSVFRRPKIIVLSTGDELQVPGSPLKDGQIYESNGVMLTLMAQKMGADVENLGIVADDKAAIASALENACKQADAVICSGGVSVGEADYTKEVLSELGKVHFWKVASKPGKPFAFGHLNKSIFFGLPGNPVSSAVTFDQLVRPALNKLEGDLNCTASITHLAKLIEPIKRRPGRAEFVRAVAKNLDDELQVTPITNQSSGVLSSMSQANCYVIVQAEQGEVEAGTLVNVQMFENRF